MKHQFKLSQEKREYMLTEIKEFFLKEREEELGELGAIYVLDFFMEKLAKEFYNQGIYDSYQYMNDKIEDLLGIQK